MIKKIIFNSIFIILLTILQLSLINNLPHPLNHFNLILVTLIFICVILSYRLSLIWLLAAGFILDLFSVNPFGLYLLSLFVAILVIHFLFKQFFTNKSIYTVLTLGLIGTILFNALIILFQFTLFYLKLHNLPAEFSFQTFGSLIWQTLLNLLFLTIVFIGAWIWSKKLKTQFLSDGVKN